MDNAMLMAPILCNGFEPITQINEFSSFIWTERYNHPGDFELVCPLTSNNLTNLLNHDGISLINTTTLDGFKMIKRPSVYAFDSIDDGGFIEYIEIRQDSTGQRHIVIKGRSWSSVLGRRIIDKQTVFTNKNASEIISSLIDTHLINPTDGTRKINNFRLGTWSIPGLTSKTVQYTGKNVLEVVEALCEEAGIGFKTADQIATKLGFGKESYVRLRSGDQKSVV